MGLNLPINARTTDALRSLHWNPTFFFLFLHFFQLEKGTRTRHYGQKKGKLWRIFWGVNKSLVNISSHIYFCNWNLVKIDIALKGTYDNLWPNFLYIKLVIYLPILSTIFCIFANGYTLIINIFYLIYFSSSSKRPERLISKLKAMNLEDAARSGRKIVVLRQPKVSFGFF